MKKVNIQSDIKLPNSEDIVFVTLEEEGAAFINFNTNIDHAGTIIHVVEHPGDNPGVSYSTKHTALALRGWTLKCAGVVWSAGQNDDVRVRCVFTMGSGQVKKSDWASMKLTTNDSAGAFKITCDFV